MNQTHSTPTFRPIPGFARYEVSTLGEIRNIKTGTILKPQMQSSGYYSNLIRADDGTRKHILVHRAVCLAFKPNPHNHPEVDHINHNRTDNTLGNLRWSSVEDNRRNKTRPFPPYRNDVISLLETGMSGSAIAQHLGIIPCYVYKIRKEMSL